MTAPESNGYRRGRACSAAHRTGIWAYQGHDPLFLWLRWVEVSPKRFSLPSLLTHSDRCTCPFGQTTKFCVPLFLFDRRNLRRSATRPTSAAVDPTSRSRLTRPRRCKCVHFTSTRHSALNTFCLRSYATQPPFGVRGKSNIFRLVHVPSLTRPTLDMNGCTGTAEDLHSGCR